MAKFLLSLHVLAAIIAIGPVTVAASMFPRKAAAALATTAPAANALATIAGGAGAGAGVLPDGATAGVGDPEATASVRLLFRITQVYAAIGLAVPVLGIGTAQVMGVMGSAWLIASLVITGLAALVLMFLVLPRQQAVIAALAGEPDADAARALGGLKLLTMSTGLFSLLWAVVTVLMVLRPGSTTGA
ncbi:hypothetical protein OG455_28345 [Kitasatospora sp. NBC_01287]|uniref:hypothetical protein n=1 Tax=Kitasatospora sp. NBC_01287 TaxID=2903573 RepID=UPI0022507788|nr:hypothetical protein [Kitasatospora sp. NBC_01287]MCX4749373.1 hypothetical protein [Kitasatospora sp. NBC_01287]